MNNLEQVENDYLTTFVQAMPHFTVKPSGGSWVRNKYPFNFNTFKKDHLETGKTDYAFIAKWYPGYCVLDADDRSKDFVEDIRGRLGLTNNNSMLFQSESPDSYHVLFRVNYKGKPETQKLLTQVMQPFAQEHGIEVYPQANRTIRAPFGRNSTILNPDMMFNNWKDHVYWFGKLDEYDLSDVPFTQLFLPMDEPSSRAKIPAFQIGFNYWQNGLQTTSERDRAQFHVLYYLFRKNVPLHTAIESTYEWLKRSHNGFSKEINAGNWQRVYKHIQTQASIIYSYSVYPDETHNIYGGFLTKEDIRIILIYCDASLPRARFLFHLVKFYYPRRQRIPRGTPVHSDLLIQWSSRGSYRSRIKELEEDGLIHRSNFYVTGQRSKDIILEWNFQSPNDAIIIDDRAPDTLEESIAVAFTPEETRSLLEQTGMDRSATRRYLKTIYEKNEDNTDYDLLI